MNFELHPDWEDFLKGSLDKENMARLKASLKKEYRDHNCFPPENKIFAAFDYFPPEEVKVVILGQDPYHGRGQAHGLAFSVNEGVTNPPSLRNILKEVHAQEGEIHAQSGCLIPWSKQGVLLLNTILTVREGQPGSHEKLGWQQFTDTVIQRVNDAAEGVIFMLWGGHARKKKKLIDSDRHNILESGHPSPLSANRGLWFGNDHFSQANELLKARGKVPIDW
ncbi:uracil-DNA glycosylase [Robertkochia aurantiaca]|uniref:uracil-DNA glycosylase n=1 Tax=Robertkochia aurantiaca TaxID=2873700 RepID=UPI001CCAAB01|nr:uracil-DNA glycosylase [Robertkochia sp. 3YJGBD-33]